MPASGDNQRFRSPPLRIGLLGPYHSRNLGDTATQIAVMDNLRRRYPGVEFLGICLDPIDAAATHHIQTVDLTGSDRTVISWDQPSAPHKRSTFPRRWKLPDLLADAVDRFRRFLNIARLAGKIDLLVISGGGQIDDFWGGPWGRPFELLAWSLTCRLRGRKVAAFGTGLDNLSTRLGTLMAFTAMRLAHYRMFRDSETGDALQRAGIQLPSSVGPDPAFSLDAETRRYDPTTNFARRVVVICPISESAWKRKADPSYWNYRDALLRTCIDLLRTGIQVHLSNSQSGMDVPVIQDLAQSISNEIGATNNVPIIKLANTVKGYCAIAAEADLVIASRLHGVILPIVVGTPVIGISYMRKVTLMMNDAGLADKCLELSSLTSETLTGLALASLGDSREIRAHLQSRNEKFRSILSEKYDELLDLGLGTTTQHRAD